MTDNPSWSDAEADFWHWLESQPELIQTECSVDELRDYWEKQMQESGE